MSQDLVCPECAGLSHVLPRPSFLGNPMFSCQDCRKVVMHPLSTPRAIFYLVVLSLMLLATVRAVSQGVVVVPGLLGLCTIYALGRDVRLRRRLAEARERRWARLRAPRI